MSARSVGAYEFEGLLGEGGIGQVFAAQDKVLGRPVAIKMLRPELSRDRSFVERFYVEAKSLGNLNHTNITTLYALHIEGDDAFMVMELVHGLTLDALLARVRRLAVRDALAVLAQAIPGLRYAHRRGVVHRDIKPANLMLTDEGVVKIMDFGIARVRGSQHLTRVGEFCGTFVYASPEQIRGDEVDERSDLYSLAIVFYRMLAGDPPFAATNEYALMTAQLQQPPPPLTGQVAGLDPAVERAVMRALAKRPEDRFASVEEFGRAVGAMELRGDSVDMLQQLYGRATREENLEATRVMSARPPPPRERTMPSNRPASLPPLPAVAEEDRFRLPDALPAAEPIATGKAASKPSPPRRNRGLLGAVAVAALTIPLALGGVYLGFFESAGGPGLATPRPPLSQPRANGSVAHAAALPPKVEPSSPVAAAKSAPPALVDAKTGPPSPIEAANTKAAAPAPSPPGRPETKEAALSSPATTTAAGKPSIAETPAAGPKPGAPEPVATTAAPPPSPPGRPETKEAALSSPAAPAAASAPVAEPPAADPKPHAPEPVATTAAPSPAEIKPKQPPSSDDRAGAATRLASAQPNAPAPAPALGPRPPAGPPEPEGRPDLEGKVTGARGLGEIEVAGRWIKIYGIIDNVRGRQQEQHADALIRYLKPSRNHLICYRKPTGTYRCYSAGQDIAQSALRDRIVRLAPNAPAEYRSLLAQER